MKHIIANWKSNHHIASSHLWFEQFAEGVLANQLLDSKQLQVVIAPPFPLLVPGSVFIQEMNDYNLSLGVQDLSAFGSGAYTGEVSADNLKNLSVGYALIGHSERRSLLNETERLAAKKVEQALEHGIRPVLCLSQKTVKSQRKQLTDDQLADLIIAYEPPEAISTNQGQEVDPSELEPAVVEIKQLYQNAPVLYGGSVDEKNVQNYLQVTDGVLVGGASLQAKSLLAVISAASKAL